MAKTTTSPRILFYDIETAPLIGFAWQKWETDIIDTVRDWYILSFAYKWEGESSIHAHSLPDFSLYKKNPEDDREIVKKLWEIINEADIVVAHNGDQFDIKKMNARFIAHGLTPPEPYKTIDTKKIAKSSFRFDSNKLDELGRYLGVGRKLAHTGFHLWKGCMRGDMQSWKLMVRYNKQDIKLLEDVYLKLRPWMKSFPIVSAENGECKHCGEIKSQRRGFSYTTKYKAQRLQCIKCGAWRLGNKELING